MNTRWPNPAKRLCVVGVLLLATVWMSASAEGSTFAQTETPLARFSLLLVTAFDRAKRVQTAHSTTLRDLATRAPRSPQAASSRITPRSHEASTGPAEAVLTWPYCYRGTNALGRDPMPSGPCVDRVWNPAGRARPKGTIILIAGGEWLSDPAWVSLWEFARMDHAWLAAGYQTITVEHTSGILDGVGGLGPYGFEDVLQWYDLIRYDATRSFGAAYPVCVAGGSSGGNFAVLVGVVRSPSCIEVEAAPVNLPELQGFSDGLAYGAAVNAFGEPNLSSWSPIRYPLRSQIPVLTGDLPDDNRLQSTQMLAFAVGRPSVSTMMLTPTGPDAPECRSLKLFMQRYFNHVCVGTQEGVTQASIDAWHAREVSLLRFVSQRRRVRKDVRTFNAMPDRCQWPSVSASGGQIVPHWWP